MELVLGFILGTISTAIVGWYIYARQKGEAAQTEQNLIALIQQQLAETGKVASTMMLVQNDVRSLVGSGRADQPPSTESLQAFTAVASAVASNNFNRVFQRSPKTESLSPEIIQSLHRQLVSQAHGAGQYRNIKVWIGSNNSQPDNARYTPPPPEVIAARLSGLTQDWVKQFPSLKQADTEKQLDAIVRFHHSFVSLHPFLDGNGILGRLLLVMQWRDLTGSKREFAFSRMDYYSALQSADAGDYLPLIELVRANLVS